MSVDKIADVLDTIELSRADYNELVRRESFLSCLESCGVDNWEGYDYAIEMFQEEYPDAVDD